MPLPVGAICYSVWTRTDLFRRICDLFLLAAIYTATVAVERFIAPTRIQYPYSYAYKLA